MGWSEKKLSELWALSCHKEWFFNHGSQCYIRMTRRQLWQRWRDDGRKWNGERRMRCAGNENFLHISAMLGTRVRCADFNWNLHISIWKVEICTNEHAGNTVWDAQILTFHQDMRRFQLKPALLCFAVDRGSDAPISNGTWQEMGKRCAGFIWNLHNSWCKGHGQGTRCADRGLQIYCVFACFWLMKSAQLFVKKFFPIQGQKGDAQKNFLFVTTL